MPHATWIPEADCAIAQSLGVFGDAWDLLIVRDLARGHRRFDQLTAELGISRKVLTERLRKLEANSIVQRLPYQDSPARYEYHLTERGSGLVPVLVALQDWGDRWLLGDGTPSGLDTPSSAHRVQGLVGTVVPALTLPTTSGSGDPVGPGITVLFGFPLAGGGPAGWAEIPGAVGCTLENRLFREAYPQLVEKGVTVQGVSTQRPDEQAAFAEREELPFPLLSDADLQLAGALRLPTFRMWDTPRLRRIALLIGADRVVRQVYFPVTDIPGLVNRLLQDSSVADEVVP